MTWNYQDMRRHQLEAGTGGDHDKPYEFTPVTGWLLTMQQLKLFLSLVARVLDGTIGGPNDGQSEIGEPAPGPDGEAPETA